MATLKFSAVLFDCDGVLVDSEPLTHQVLRKMLAEAGWSMTQAECMAYFVGKTVREERVEIEARTGQPLTQDWLNRFYQRRNQALMADLLVIPGAMAAVRAAQPCGPTVRNRQGMLPCCWQVRTRCFATWPMCRRC